MSAIFDKDPDDWRALQDMTGQLFAEIGCNVQVGRNLQTIRGAKEIDVYVRDEGVAPPATYLCECKHWKRAVPQEIVHAFRAVLGDAGAHRGFIISSIGFQQGAFEARVAACMPGTLDFTDNSQDVGGELTRLGLKSPAHAFYGTGGVRGRAQPLNFAKLPELMRREG